MIIFRDPKVPNAFLALYLLTIHVTSFNEGWSALTIIWKIAAEFPSLLLLVAGGYFTEPTTELKGRRCEDEVRRTARETRKQQLALLAGISSIIFLKKIWLDYIGFTKYIALDYFDDFHLKIYNNIFYLNLFLILSHQNTLKLL